MAYEKGENLPKKGSTNKVLITLCVVWGLLGAVRTITETYCFNELLVCKFHTSTICLGNIYIFFCLPNGSDECPFVF